MGAQRPRSRRAGEARDGLLKHIGVDGLLQHEVGPQHPARGRGLSIIGLRRCPRQLAYAAFRRTRAECMRERGAPRVCLRRSMRRPHVALIARQVETKGKARDRDAGLVALDRLAAAIAA